MGCVPAIICRIGSAMGVCVLGLWAGMKERGGVWGVRKGVTVPMPGGAICVMPR